MQLCSVVVNVNLCFDMILRVCRLQDWLEASEEEEVTWLSVIEKLQKNYKLPSTKTVDTKHFKSTVMHLFKTKLKRRTFRGQTYVALSRLKWREHKSNHVLPHAQFLQKPLSTGETEYVYLYNENVHVNILHNNDSITVKMNGKIIEEPSDDIEIVMRIILANKPCLYRYTAACTLILSSFTESSVCRRCAETNSRRALKDKTNTVNCEYTTFDCHLTNHEPFI